MKWEISSILISIIIIGLLISSGILMTNYQSMQDDEMIYGNSIFDVGLHENYDDYETIDLDEVISGITQIIERTWVMRDNTFYYLHYIIEKEKNKTIYKYSITSIKFNDDLSDIINTKTDDILFDFRNTNLIGLDVYDGFYWSIQSIMSKTYNSNQIIEYNLLKYNATHLLSNRTINAFDKDKFIESDYHLDISSPWFYIINDKEIIYYYYYSRNNNSDIISNIVSIDRDTLQYKNSWYDINMGFYEPLITENKLWLRTSANKLREIDQNFDNSKYQAKYGIFGYDLNHFTEQGEADLSKWQIDKTVMVYLYDFIVPNYLIDPIEPDYIKIRPFILGEKLIKPYFLFYSYGDTPMELIGFQTREIKPRQIINYYEPIEYFGIYFGIALVLIGMYMLFKKQDKQL